MHRRAESLPHFPPLTATRVFVRLARTVSELTIDGLRCAYAMVRALVLFPSFFVLLTLFVLWPWRFRSPIRVAGPLGTLQRARKASVLRLVALRLEVRLESLLESRTTEHPALRFRSLLRWFAYPIVRTIPNCANLARRELERDGRTGLLKTLTLFFDSLVDSLRYGNGVVTRKWFDPERRHNAAFHIPNHFHIKCFCHILNHKINPNMPAEQAHYDKLELFKVCQEHGWPTVPVYAGFASGRVTRHDPLEYGPLISKPAGLAEGKGHFERWWPELDAPGSTRQYRADDGSLVTFQDILDRVGERASDTPYLLQKLISNHQDIRALSGVDGLCTLRLSTCCYPDGRVELLTLGGFRMQSKKNAVFDNMAKGGIAYRVNTSTGCLEAGAKYGSYDAFAVHPVTWRRVPGFVLPYWKESVELCTTAHAVGFANYPSVGWDIAITDDGPMLLEMNIRWGSELGLPNEVFLGATAYADCILAHLQQLWPQMLSAGSHSRFAPCPGTALLAEGTLPRLSEQNIAAASEGPEAARSWPWPSEARSSEEQEEAYQEVCS